MWREKGHLAIGMLVTLHTHTYTNMHYLLNTPALYMFKVSFLYTTNSLREQKSLLVTCAAHKFAKETEQITVRN
jgi:hypothetical protein